MDPRSSRTLRAGLAAGGEPARLRRDFVAKLRERAGPMDLETALEIERTLAAGG